MVVGHFIGARRLVAGEGRDQEALAETGGEGRAWVWDHEFCWEP